MAKAKKKMLEALDKFSIHIGMKNANYEMDEIKSSLSFFEATASEKEIEEIRKFYHQYGDKITEVDGKTSF